MKLVTDELHSQLPPLYSQEAEADPIVYAKFFLPGTNLCWFVIEGQATENAGYVLSCLFTGDEECSFGHFPESFLEAFRGPDGELVVLDISFKPGRLTDVVPAPDT